VKDLTSTAYLDDFQSQTQFRLLRDNYFVNYLCHSKAIQLPLKKKSTFLTILVIVGVYIMYSEYYY